jgi:hypothetical protein
MKLLPEGKQGSQSRIQIDTSLELDFYKRELR